MKVLIVDDAPTVRSLVKTTLQAMGIAVVGASNGKEALDVVKREDFALIISDINMPVMDGLDFLKAFRSFNRRTPFLVLTTESDPGKKEIAKKLGATGWIVKPFKAQDLSSVVRRFVR